MEPDGGEVRAACEQQASCRAHGSAGLSQLPWRKTPGPEVCLPRFSPAVPPANHTRPQSHLMRPKHVSSPCKTQHGCGSHPNAPQHLGEAADRSHHLEHTVQPRCVTQWKPALSSMQGKEVTHLKQLKAANPCLASPQGQVSSCPHCSTPPATCLQPLALPFPCIQAACAFHPSTHPLHQPSTQLLGGHAELCRPGGGQLPMPRQLPVQKSHCPVQFALGKPWLCSHAQLRPAVLLSLDIS